MQMVCVHFEDIYSTIQNYCAASSLFFLVFCEEAGLQGSFCVLFHEIIRIIAIDFILHFCYID